MTKPPKNDPRMTATESATTHGNAVAAPAPASSRAMRAAERREAIIAAGLDEFVARGFARNR